MSETANSTLPAKVSLALTTREQYEQKLEFLEGQEKKIKAAKKLIKDALDKNDALFLELHKEHGDFEIGGFSVKKSVTYSTVVLDEKKLPAECFTIKQEKKVSLAKVKELIVDGVIPATVAIQQKNENVKIK